MKSFLSGIALASVAMSSAESLRSIPLEFYSYDQWLVDYKPILEKVQDYNPDVILASAEYLRRKNIFEKNLQTIRDHNRRAALGQYKWTMDVNQFADQTEEEALNKFTGHSLSASLRAKPHHFSQTQPKKSTIDISSLPKKVNWIEEGAVGDAKHQGGCGSCWAFAALTAVESHGYLSTGKMLNLSTQQLTSCAPNPRKCGGIGGCFGSTTQLGYEYSMSAGITLQDSYPYKSGTGGNTYECLYDPKITPPVVSVGNYQNLPTNEKHALLEALATKGPVAVTVAAGAFIFYGDGIFNGCSLRGDINVNHAVVAVGYDITDKDNSYILIRNSWGGRWGEEGNIRLELLLGEEGKENCFWNTTPQDGSACEGEDDPVLVCGECGVFSDASYPKDVKLL